MDSPETKALNQWHMASSIRGMSTYVEFFPHLEEMIKNLSFF